ncbi:MAG: alkaline phosphatase D family protein [Saprospiraceae bacterium]|nr:alkaline phosphatase D family protein [Candidatus Brachybacter algidus]
MNFFEEDSASFRRQHEGIYDSYSYGPRGKRVQIILLDTRTFRDNLRPYAGELKNDSRYFYELDYTPEISKDSTLLGAAQWKWLEEQLNMPADIRIIGSSTQFGVEFNGYESWANFPNEQKKMLDLIDKTQAGGVIFLSGDVHYSEMSRIKRDGTYPIYDFTSSGITSTWHFATPNKNRIEGPVMDNHFGLMTINWNPGQTTIKMECIDVHNNQRFEYNIPLNSIQPGLE